MANRSVLDGAPLPSRCRRGAPLQEVFDVAATMFANLLVLFDESLYFVLTAATLPQGTSMTR